MKPLARPFIDEYYLDIELAHFMYIIDELCNFIALYWSACSAMFEYSVLLIWKDLLNKY